MSEEIKVSAAELGDSTAPPFVVAAARLVSVDAPYWPGKDYPDREVWLAKRAKQREKPPVVTVYHNHSRQPLALGLNNVKRRADASKDPERERQRIVKHRHGYYRDRYEGNRGTPV